MKFKRIGLARAFTIESTEYYFIDQPLEFYYFYKTSKDDVGAWNGKSNIRKKGKDVPVRHIANVRDAFQQLAAIKKSYDAIARQQEAMIAMREETTEKVSVDSQYKYAIVLDFKNHKVYYDDMEALERYFKDKFWVRDILLPRKKKEWT
jgi:hypothetical protein